MKKRYTHNKTYKLKTHTHTHTHTNTQKQYYNRDSIQNQHYKERGKNDEKRHFFLF